MTKERTRALNDALRTTFVGGKVTMTRTVERLPEQTVGRAMLAVRAYSNFTADNDPHGEHNFGRFSVDGVKFLFKIDYYDKDMNYGSDDPSDPAQTTRVLTLMLASDY